MFTSIDCYLEISVIIYSNSIRWQCHAARTDKQTKYKETRTFFSHMTNSNALFLGFIDIKQNVSHKRAYGVVLCPFFMTLLIRERQSLLENKMI